MLLQQFYLRLPSWLIVVRKILAKLARCQPGVDDELHPIYSKQPLLMCPDGGIRSRRPSKALALHALPVDDGVVV